MSRINHLADYLTEILDCSVQYEGSSVSVLRVLNDFVESNSSTADVPHLISKLCKMVDCGVDDIRMAPGLPQQRRHLHIKRLSAVRDVVACFVSATNWVQVQEFFTRDLIEELQIIDDALTAGGLYHPFKNEMATEYAKELKTILDNINLSDLDNRLKRGITSHLEVLISIFQNYGTFGAEDAEIRMKAVMGDIVIYSDEYAKASKSAKTAVFSYVQFVKKLYPGFKLSADLSLTAANAVMLAIQSGAIS